jgi:putative flippase GtrA
MSLQFTYFLLSGGIASLINWSSRFLFSQYFNFKISVIFAFLIGLLSGFILMRLFVFKSTKNPMKLQVIRYLIINFLALVQTVLVSVLFLNLMAGVLESKDTSEAIAHALGIAVPVFTSYLGHKYFTFR